MRGSVSPLPPPSPLAIHMESTQDYVEATPAEDPLADVPELKTYIAQDEGEKIAALKADQQGLDVAMAGVSHLDYLLSYWLASKALWLGYSHLGRVLAASRIGCPASGNLPITMAPTIRSPGSTDTAASKTLPQPRPNPLPWLAKAVSAGGAAGNLAKGGAPLTSRGPAKKLVDG